MSEHYLQTYQVRFSQVLLEHTQRSVDNFGLLDSVPFFSPMYCTIRNYILEYTMVNQHC
jgi:hypothetical protein